MDTARMVDFYECFECRKVAPLASAAEPRCALCGSDHGHLLTTDAFHKGLETGVCFDIDPRTGTRAKPRRR